MKMLERKEQVIGTIERMMEFSEDIRLDHWPGGLSHVVDVTAHDLPFWFWTFWGVDTRRTTARHPGWPGSIVAREDLLRSKT